MSLCRRAALSQCIASSKNDYRLMCHDATNIRRTDLPLVGGAVAVEVDVDALVVAVLVREAQTGADRDLTTQQVDSERKAMIAWFGTS